MDPLAEWHRYVDSLSRPVNRPGEEKPVPAPASSWRPWLREEEPDAPRTGAAPIVELPDLSAALGAAGMREARQHASVEFEDLTIHDELQPMPEFRVPNLRAPSFELSAPGPLSVAGSAGTPAAGAKGGAAAGVPALREPDAALEVRDHGGSGEDEDTAGDEPSSGEFPETLRASRYWELLNRMRGEDGVVDTRSRARVAREELLHRLVDPTLTLEETALILEVCPTTVRRYTNRGLLRHFRTKGNQRRFRFSDVLEFMESRAAEIEEDSRADREAGGEAIPC